MLVWVCDCRCDCLCVWVCDCLCDCLCVWVCDCLCVRACVRGSLGVADGQENVEEIVFAELSGAKRRPRLAGLRNDTWPTMIRSPWRSRHVTRKGAAWCVGATAATVNRVETQADANFIRTRRRLRARSRRARIRLACNWLPKSARRWNWCPAGASKAREASTAGQLAVLSRTVCRGRCAWRFPKGSRGPKRRMREVHIRLAVVDCCGCAKASHKQEQGQPGHPCYQAHFGASVQGAHARSRADMPGFPLGVGHGSAKDQSQEMTLEDGKDRRPP